MSVAMTKKDSGKVVLDTYRTLIGKAHDTSLNKIVAALMITKDYFAHCSSFEIQMLKKYRTRDTNFTDMLDNGATLNKSQ